MTRRGWIRTVIGIVLLVVAVVGIGGMQSELEQAFDRGMRAGVEYQEYFCPTAPQDTDDVQNTGARTGSKAASTDFQP